MLLRIDRPKVKHMVGSYKGSHLFPEREDLEYIVLRWFYMEGGRKAVASRGGAVEEPAIAFSVLVDKIGDAAGPAVQAAVDGGYARPLEVRAKKSDPSPYYSLTELLTYGPPPAAIEGA